MPEAGFILIWKLLSRLLLPVGFSCLENLYCFLRVVFPCLQDYNISIGNVQYAPYCGKVTEGAIVKNGGFQKKATCFPGGNNVNPYSRIKCSTVWGKV